MIESKEFDEELKNDTSTTARDLLKLELMPSQSAESGFHYNDKKENESITSGTFDQSNE